jgi:glyoxylate reductase
VAVVLVTRQLPEGALEPLAGHELVGPDPHDRPLDPAELRAAARDVDAIVCTITDRVDAAVLASPRLTVVATVSVGFDHVDVAAASARGIVVANTPGVLDGATADLALLLVLAARRRSTEAEADLRAGRWTGWGLLDHLGHDVGGATLGLVGYGRIGRALAARAAACGMTVLHHTRRPTGVDGWVGRLDDLLARSDVVSLHVPSTPETHHLIGAPELARMRPTAVLVNTARGPVVDEAALAAALHAGRLAGAGLDVYEREPTVHPDLLGAPGTTLLPHIGSATVGTRLAMARMATTAVATVLAGGVPDHVVTPR